jgi:carotenoid cleavage dioxygenase
VSAPHRYGYTAVSAALPADAEDPKNLADDAFGNVLLKHDLARGTAETHVFARDAAVGEAVFVPSSTGAAEDDGYVMAFVHDPDRGASDLVILAAQDFTAAPIAAVHLPVRVPLGYHGSWIPSTDLS